MLTIRGREISFDCISLTLIIIGEICFYTLDTLSLYWVLTGCGFVIEILSNIGKISRKVTRDNFILWTILMFSIYFIYGLFFLQKGQFPWDTLGYRFFEIVALYLCFSNIFKKDNIQGLQWAIIAAGIFSALYLFYTEGTSILSGSQRIGDTLSGNVNTVGYNFGIISSLIMWFYCREKKVYKIVLYILFTLIMLMTGSKKVLIIIVANMAMYLIYNRKKLSGWIVTLFIAILAIYLIFNVSYFYNIIGFRIEAMFETWLYGTSSTMYSHSTDVRDEMIAEAFDLFKTRPLFGGGWNYFYAHTIYGYEYSHCNYTEMLCSFGIVGTLIFYGRHIHDLYFAWIERKTLIFENRNLLALIVLMTFEALILDWAAVTFSAQCVWYLPFIICAGAIDAIRNNEIEYYNIGFQNE